jgi:hypothetical protein
MTNMHTIFRMLVLALAIIGISAAATPNFSGHWKLNAEKSKLDDPYLGLQEDRTIEHKDPELIVNVKDVQDGEEDTNTATFRTDGKETRSYVDGDPQFTTAHWDGDALVVDSKLISDTDTTDFHDRWTLSADGKVLTITRKQKTGFDEREAVFVFDLI